jgi:hypothetical protein
MTALDTTNLRITFTAPANGDCLGSDQAVTGSATSGVTILLGVLDAATVRARQHPMDGYAQITPTASDYLFASTASSTASATTASTASWQINGFELLHADTLRVT